MQEEVENRTVNLAISTTKLTFRTIVNGYNAWKRHHQAKVAQKTSQLPIGKQSIKELIGQNQGVSSIPIEKTDLKGFEQVAQIRRGLCHYERPKCDSTQVHGVL